MLLYFHFTVNILTCFSWIQKMYRTVWSWKLGGGGCMNFAVQYGTSHSCQHRVHIASLFRLQLHLLMFQLDAEKHVRCRNNRHKFSCVITRLPSFLFCAGTWMPHQLFQHKIWQVFKARYFQSSCAAQPGIASHHPAAGRSLRRDIQWLQ